MSPSEVIEVALFHEKQPVTFTWLSRHMDVDVNTAKEHVRFCSGRSKNKRLTTTSRYLDEYYQEARRRGAKDKVQATFYISGVLDTEKREHNHVAVQQHRLDAVKKRFAEIHTEQVYSLQLGEVNNLSVLGTLNFGVHMEYKEYARYSCLKQLDPAAHRAPFQWLKQRGDGDEPVEPARPRSTAASAAKSASLPAARVATTAPATPASPPKAAEKPAKKSALNFFGAKTQPSRSQADTAPTIPDSTGSAARKEDRRPPARPAKPATQPEVEDDAVGKRSQASGTKRRRIMTLDDDDEEEEETGTVASATGNAADIFKDDDAMQHVGEAESQDTAEPAAPAPPPKAKVQRKRRVKKDNTFVDARGCLVTTTVYESEYYYSSDDNQAQSAPPAKVARTASAPKRQESQEQTASGKGKARGKPDPKSQQKLSSFFTRR
ncbi:hypothetical protein RI367_006809 [Sorochytrium milnesiophthora]